MWFKGWLLISRGHPTFFDQQTLLSAKSPNHFPSRKSCCWDPQRSAKISWNWSFFLRPSFPNVLESPTEALMLHPRFFKKMASIDGSLSDSVELWFSRRSAHLSSNEMALQVYWAVSMQCACFELSSISKFETERNQRLIHAIHATFMLRISRMHLHQTIQAKTAIVVLWLGTTSNVQCDSECMCMWTLHLWARPGVGLYMSVQFFVMPLINMHVLQKLSWQSIDSDIPQMCTNSFKFQGTDIITSSPKRSVKSPPTGFQHWPRLTIPRTCVGAMSPKKCYAELPIGSVKSQDWERLPRWKNLTILRSV